MEFCALYLILKNPQSALFMGKWYCLLYAYFSLHAKLVKPILHDQVSFGGILKICGHILNTSNISPFLFPSGWPFLLFFSIGRGFLLFFSKPASPTSWPISLSSPQPTCFTPKR